MGASASELAEAKQCILSCHFMFDRDDFIYKLVKDDYMELLNSIDDDEIDVENIDDYSLEQLRNKKRIVFSSDVPFSGLPEIEGWFRNTTAPQCVLIALLQHFNWLITPNGSLSSSSSLLDNKRKNEDSEIPDRWDTFAINYNKFITKGRNFDGYNIEFISEDERLDLKHSFDRIEFSINDEIHYKLSENNNNSNNNNINLNIQEQCWEDDIWIGNARDSEEWLEFLERRFDKDEIHLRCIIKTDEMEPKFFLKFMNRIMCHEGADIVFDKKKIEQVKEWDEMNQIEQDSSNTPDIQDNIPLKENIINQIVDDSDVDDDNNDYDNDIIGDTDRKDSKKNNNKKNKNKNKNKNKSKSNSKKNEGENKDKKSKSKSKSKHSTKSKGSKTKNKSNVNKSKKPSGTLSDKNKGESNDMMVEV